MGISVLHRGKKEIGQNSTSISPKGNQNWMYIGRTDAEAEAPKLWPSDAKSWLIGKNLDAGKDWRQEEMGVAEDEILEDVIYSMDMNLSKLREIVKDRKLWHATASWRIGHYWVNEQQHRVFFVFFSKAHNKQNWWINP